MKKILFSLLCATSVSAFATIGDTALSNADYCKQIIGGTVETVTPKYYYASYSYDSGLDHKFCVVTEGKHKNYLGLEVLSKQSSIASTILQTANLDSNQPIPGGQVADLCIILGGADSRLNNSYDSSTEMCVFGDGSSIGTWTLYEELTAEQHKYLLRSKPLEHYKTPDLSSFLKKQIK